LHRARATRRDGIAIAHFPMCREVNVLLPDAPKIFCTACIRERVDGPLDAQKRANRTQLIRPATSFADRIEARCDMRASRARSAD